MGYTLKEVSNDSETIPNIDSFHKKCYWKILRFQQTKGTGKNIQKNNPSSVFNVLFAQENEGEKKENQYKQIYVDFETIFRKKDNCENKS